MAIVDMVDILEHQIILQRDARDPLGVWVSRQAIAGDATGGSIKQEIRATATQTGGRIYTCHAVNMSGISGSVVSGSAKIRFLTNFPDADRTAGVQGFATLRVTGFTMDSGFTAPIAGLSGETPASMAPTRILLFGPQLGATEATIVEVEFDQNVDGAVYSVETYGWFWDRQVLRIAGGPRYPMT